MQKNNLKGLALGTTISLAFYVGANKILLNEHNEAIKQAEIYRTEKQYIFEEYNKSLKINEELNHEINRLQSIVNQNNIDYNAMKEKLDNTEAKLLKYTTSRTINKSHYKVAIDMGHNLTKAKDTGAVYNELKEDQFTMEIGLRVKSILEENDIMVINSTPSPNSTTSNVKDSLDRRIDVANQNNVDLFLSIHLNSASNDASGVETWVKNDDSKHFAQSITDNISNDMKIPNRGVKISENNSKGDLYVLKHSNVPAVLVECFFLTNQQDVEKYDLDKLANSIASAIIDELQGE